MKSEGTYTAARREGGPRVGAIYDNIPPARHVNPNDGEPHIPERRDGGKPDTTVHLNRKAENHSDHPAHGSGSCRGQVSTASADIMTDARGKAAIPTASDPSGMPISGSPAQHNVLPQRASATYVNENLLVGRNPIREALRAGRSVEKLLVAKGDLSGSARDIIRMAKEAGVVVQTVERSRLDEIYPAHQGMLAYVAAVPYVSVDELFAIAASRGEDPFFVLLDGVTDPHNLGAILRSAECAGAHGAILPERRSAGLGPAAAKAAAGALDCLSVARVKNLNRAIDELKARGVWVIGTSLQGEDALSADLSGPIALVIGSEGNGVSRLTLDKCDRTLTLPMRGKIGSLNASVAAGILMYEVLRARRQ